MNLITQIILVVVLLILSGFFSSSETALFSLSKVERRRMQKRKTWMSQQVLYHLEHPRRTLVTILIGNMLVNILSTVIVTLVAMNIFGVGGVGITLIFFTLLLILFAEILPKILAVRNNENLALAFSFPLRVFSFLIYPFIAATLFVTNKILSALIQKKKEITEHISGDELKAMIKIGEKEGVLDSQERYMIQKLIELGERPVKDIMTPRIDMKALDIEDSRSRHLGIVEKFHYTHFPVFQESRDNILGVISAQVYVLNPDISHQDLLKQPLFIPESKKIDDLLAEFKNKNETFAVCVDEYGGTAGIVTLEDILEEIFGEYYDEYAQVENPIRPHGTGEYLVESKISLLDFNEYFKLKLKDDEASTLGGWILNRLGEVPEKGKILETDGCEIEIQEVIRKRRIHRVLVRIKS